MNLSNIANEDIMAEPTSSAASAGWLGSKLFPPLMGFLGACLTLLYTNELNRKRMLVAITFGIASAIVGPPILIPALREGAGLSWIPTNGSAEGLIGLILGVASINIVALLLNFSANPASLRDVISGKGKPKE
jgi:Na+/proline symporter